MIVDVGAYCEGRRIASPPLDELGRWAGRPDVFVWLGLRIPTRDELDVVRASLGLDDLDVDDALAPHDRPVLTDLDRARWLVLRTARYHDSQEKVALGEMSVIYGTDFLVTIRYGQASPLTRLRQTLEADPARLAAGVPAVLAAVVTQVVEDYSPALDGLEHDVLEAEDQVFDSRLHPPVRRLYFLKRQILQLLVVSDAVQEPLHRLSRELSGDPADEVQLALARAARVTQRTRTLSDLVTTAVDVNLTQVSLQQNADMRRISAWVAIAAVPTMVAGIYGMNFAHMPELRWQFGYPAVLTITAAVCLALHRSFRRSDWL